MSIFRPSEVIVGASDMGAMRRPHVDYICDGTADNVQIQAAIDALPSSGGTVVLSEGTFNIAATVTWTTSNVRIVGQGRSTVLTQVANVQIFSTSGVAATTEHALASNAALGNTTAVLGAGDGSNYAADDWIVVLSTGVWTSTTSKIGELHQVDSVSTDTLNLKGYIRDAYTTGQSAAVKKITPVSGTGISDLRITNNSQGTYTAAYIIMQAQTDFSIDNLFLDSADDAGIKLNTCWHGTISNIRCHDFTSDTNQLGYGVQIRGASEDITVSNLVGHNVRHTITSGAPGEWDSNGLDHGIPRAITVNNATAISNKSMGIDTHEEAEGWVFTGCASHGGASHGFNARGVNISFVNCVAMENANAGFRMAADADSGLVMGCTTQGNADGILLTGGCDQVRVIGNYIQNNSDGIDINAAHTDLLVHSNNFLSNSTDIEATGATLTTSQIRNNSGYITEASGTATVVSGTTSIAVTHGLSVTPTVDDIIITFNEQGTNDYGRWWVDTLTSTQFTLNVSADPGASNLTFGWRAVVL